MERDVDLLHRAKGCLLGLAIGDAMGMPTSFLPVSVIERTYGFIKDFQAPPSGHIYHQGLRRAEITDDTEQSLALATSFIRFGRIDPTDIVQELLAWAQRVENKYTSPFGPSTWQAFQRIKSGVALNEAGRNGDTNGAAMRIAPLGIIHGARSSSLEDVLSDVALACLPTHGTQVAIASATAVAWAIARCFHNQPSILDILEEAEKAAEARNQFGYPTTAPSVARRIAWVSEQVRRHRPAERILNELYELFGGGVPAADSVPVALGVFAVCQGNPRQIALMAANRGADSDTIGAIAGAIGGAYAGDQAIPAEWAAVVQQVNQIDFSSIASSLVELAQRWQPADKNEVVSFYSGGE